VVPRIALITSRVNKDPANPVRNVASDHIAIREMTTNFGSAYLVKIPPKIFATAYPIRKVVNAQLEVIANFEPENPNSSDKDGSATERFILSR
jgi:hypothetical protein